MIRILDFDKLGAEAVLARAAETPDVSDPVAEILAAVRRRATQPCGGIVWHLTACRRASPLRCQWENCSPRATPWNPPSSKFCRKRLKTSARSTSARCAKGL